MQNEGYTIGTEASGSTQIELSSTSVTLEAGGNTEEVNAKIKTSTKYMLVDGLYYPLTITNNTATLGEEGKSSLTDSSSISLSDLTLNTTGSITATFNSTTGVITITSGSEISDNNKVEIVDNNGTKYGTIDVAVISVIGDYVNYNVPYTDMNTNYGFTATNGWRILSRTESTSGSGKYDIKIISTGVPAKLYYYYGKDPTDSYNASQYNDWWGTLSQVNNMYGLNIESWSESKSGYYAAYGLIKNFNYITFNNGTSTHKGCWINVAGNTSGTGIKFIANEFMKETISIHNLTLSELNITRQLSETNTTNVATSDRNNGLFYLRDLANENNNWGYTANSLCSYWISTPKVNYERYLYYVNSDGSIDSGGEGMTLGLRPVVEIKGVTMTQDPTSKVWTISQ